MVVVSSMYRYVLKRTFPAAIDGIDDGGWVSVQERRSQIQCQWILSGRESCTSSMSATCVPVSIENSRQGVSDFLCSGRNLPLKQSQCLILSTIGLAIQNPQHSSD